MTALDILDGPARGRRFHLVGQRLTIGRGDTCALRIDDEFPGTAGVPALSSSAPPALGQVADLTITNVLPGVHPVIQFFGLAPGSFPFDGGTLLVNPLLVSVFNLPFGPQSVSLQFQVPLDPSLCGLDLYFQYMIVDPGAAGFYQTAQTNGQRWTLGW